MIRLKHIILHLLLASLPVLMAMAPAMAQDIVYTGQTSRLSIIAVPGDTYTWELYNEVTGMNFALEAGNCPPGAAFFTGGITSGATVNVSWLAPGIYFFKVTSTRSGCSNNIKVGKITVLPLLNTSAIVQPQPVCQGEIAALKIILTGQPPWIIDVSDGSATTTYENITASPFILNVSPAVTTSYTVTSVSNQYGQNTDPSNTVSLVVRPSPIFKLFAQDSTCFEHPVMLNPGIFAEYKWQDGSYRSQFAASSPGLYWVVVTGDNGCKGSDSVLLRPCELLVWLPNAFSPNGDGLNEIFEARTFPGIDINFRMLIFNKWGEQLFSSDDITQGWDGTYKGVKCPPDQYTYIIYYDAPKSFEYLQKSPQQGNVMLLQ